MSITSLDGQPAVYYIVERLASLSLTAARYQRKLWGSLIMTEDKPLPPPSPPPALRDLTDLLSTEEDRARILVVDDDALAREILADQLAEAGYLVSTAEDGKKALAMVSSESPDLILLDVIMPNLDGFEVCRRLKSDEQTILIPVVRLGAPI
jgi:hypothetical protein